MGGTLEPGDTALLIHIVSVMRAMQVHRFQLSDTCWIAALLIHNTWKLKTSRFF
jgi:hypothetical protein